MPNSHSSKKSFFTLIPLVFTGFISLSLILAPKTVQAELTFTKTTKLPVCIYIASHALVYSWQDGIEQALAQTLKNYYQIKTVFMNSKKVLDQESLQKVGLHAVDFIESHSPDVMIVSDDNSVKYVLKEYFRNSKLPFVFCGVNNSSIPCRLQYKNTTGMVEKPPTENLQVNHA